MTKTQQQSNEAILKTWVPSNKSDNSYCIVKEFHLEDETCYGDLCMKILKLEHGPNILMEIEKREITKPSRYSVISVTISATEAKVLTVDCQKLALSVEQLILAIKR